MFRRAPTNTCFETIFSKHRNTKDMSFDVFEEIHVVLASANTKLFSNVFKEMHMADLNNDIRKDILCCLFDSRIVITGDRDERVIHVLEFCEELPPSFEAF